LPRQRRRERALCQRLPGVHSNNAYNERHKQMADDQGSSSGNVTVLVFRQTAIQRLLFTIPAGF
jgi:hypothetical protein